MFIVFEKPLAKDFHHKSEGNYLKCKPVMSLQGAWKVSFDTVWGGPDLVLFDTLISWTARPEAKIKYFSGEANYRKTFVLPTVIENNKRIYLDLGIVKNVAEIWLNGQNLGVVWCEPYRVDITNVVNKTENQLEIKVVNVWNNRLIGDANLPKEQRKTKTNIEISPNGKLLDSGLLGTVKLLITE